MIIIPITVIKIPKEKTQKHTQLINKTDCKRGQTSVGRASDLGGNHYGPPSIGQNKALATLTTVCRYKIYNSPDKIAKNMWVVCLNRLTHQSVIDRQTNRWLDKFSTD